MWLVLREEKLGEVKKKLLDPFYRIVLFPHTFYKGGPILQKILGKIHKTATKFAEIHKIATDTKIDNCINLDMSFYYDQ